MQTFFCEADAETTARSLDSRRLGKQRVEAIQVARANLGLTERSGWLNHPCTRMWRPYMGYLVRVYLPAMLTEWERRGYRNDACLRHLEELSSIAPKNTESPAWLSAALIQSHRSNLIRKNPDHYRKLWPEVPDDLPYVWPD